MELKDYSFSDAKLQGGATFPLSRITDNPEEKGYIKVRYIYSTYITQVMSAIAEEYRKEHGIVLKDDDNLDQNVFAGIKSKEVRDRLGKQAIAKHVIAGWEGITLNGEVYEYNETNAYDLMDKPIFKKISDAIMEFASEEVNYRERSVQELKKKPEELPVG